MAEAAIEVEGLTKDYPYGFLQLKKKRSLDALTMQVQTGEVFGFLGPNGAGKSTTIKLLMRLIFPTAGSARMSGEADQRYWRCIATSGTCRSNPIFTIT